MSDPDRVKRENRKLRFLKAFARIGTIAGAARASRISRDAAHDWINGDVVFARRMAETKRRFHDEEFQHLQSTLIFFQHIARPLIPRDIWSRLTAELALAVLRLKSDLGGTGPRRSVPSGITVEIPLSPRIFGDVAVLECGNGASTANLMYRDKIV